MNELLGWYGYDKVELRDSDDLEIRNHPDGEIRQHISVLRGESRPQHGGTRSTRLRPPQDPAPPTECPSHVRA